MAVGGSIYVFGGLVSTPQGTAATSSVERFLLEENRWEPVADLPEPRHHSMAASVSGVIYLLGGFDARGFNPVATVWSFDPSTGIWSEESEMPAPNGAGAAVTVDGRIFVAGGVPDGTALFVYDPGSNAWQVLSGMSKPREHLAAVAFEDKVWAIGGRWEGDMRRTLEIFDPSTGTWSPAPDMLEARSGFGASNFDGSIIVAGGEVFSPTRALDSVEVFDGSEWIETEALPVALHGVPLVSVDNRVYILSGSREAGAVENSGEVWSLAP